VYDAMLAEDNGLRLETTVFAEGITDPYHARAKAEELCRTSRSALKATFQYIIEDTFYEPGDFVRLESDDLELGLLSNLYARVDSAKAVKEDRCELEIVRFDASQLAWAVQDDVYIGAPPVMGYFLPQPEEILYVNPDNTVNAESSGILNCTPVSSPEVVGYVWYVHRAGIDPVDDVGKPIFTEMGRTTETVFILPRIEAASAFFGVRCFANNGKVSLMTTTDPLVAITLVHLWNKQVVLSSASDVYQIDQEPIRFDATLWSIPNNTIKWFVDDVLQTGWSDDYYYLDKFTDTNQKSVRVAVIDNDTDKTYEDVIDVGYISPGDTSGSVETWYLQQYEPPNSPTTYPPETGWVLTLPDFGNITRWQTTIRVDGGEAASPWTAPAKIDTLIFRGEYAADVDYFIDHVVQFSGFTYIATTDYLLNDPPTGTAQANVNWALFSGSDIGGDPDPGDPPTVLNIDIVASTTTVNLRTLADAAGFDNLTPFEINYTVIGDVIGTPGNGGITGTKDGQPGNHGIDTGTWPETAILTLTLSVPSGRLVSGGGGGGGLGDIVPGNGGNGGDGVHCRVDIDIDNEGTIQGATGGGAAGQSGGYSETPYVYRYPGGGGGGGIPYGKGGSARQIDSRLSSVY